MTGPARTEQQHDIDRSSGQVWAEVMLEMDGNRVVGISR